jgi:hypothetical protein
MEPAVLLKEAAAVIGATGVIFAAVIGFLRFIRKPLVKFKREIDEALAAIKKIEPMAEAIARRFGVGARLARPGDVVEV